MSDEEKCAAEKIEVRELEPLSFDEAKAMVVLLGGAHAMPPISPGVGLMPMRHQVTPLQTLFASLPPAQRQTFMATMDRVWPKPQRHRRNKPVDMWGFSKMYGEHYIGGWDDAWAAAFSAASYVGETAMSIAMRRARGAKGRWRKS